ncbi:MAG TPA: Tar ligand binding domain-containing protein, partial [Eoetvoesiella sp.]|uniref:Tar ligand binding domain-containing protein n=1 Tax=Eoetvoesiella sp. TaxID=1966355 RepID=UPI002CF02DD6
MDVKVSTRLMACLLVFMILIIIVGGIGAYFLDANARSERALAQQNASTRLVSEISNEMLQARLGMMTAARYQESNVNDDAAMAEEGKATLNAAMAQLAKVKSNFESFRKNPPQGEEGGKLAQALIDAYKVYDENGIAPMVQALSYQDYGTFYFVNNQIGIDRAKAFDKAIEDLKTHTIKQEDLFHAQAEIQFKKALTVIGAGIAIGVVLVFLVMLLFKRTVIRPLVLAGGHFDRIAGGDLTQRVEVKSRNEIGVLYEALRRMQESLTRTVSEVRQGVQEIDVGAREIFMGNTDLSSRTEQQAASLQETAASMEQLAGTVRQNTDNALQADGLAKAASGVAQRGGEAVSKVVGTMEAISSSSGKIAEIVSVIDGIAFQT